MTKPDQPRVALIEFLYSIARPDGSLEEIGDHDNLVDAGFMDSLAVVHVIVYLETTYAINLSANDIQPDTLVSLAGILDVIDGCK